ncbi:hypothetical protein [Bordetella genomosp. 13]|uniref:hypothetical protein n=1 Tax=Bordetella genomosp. 13 TaxID=463040 RepID=UPI0011A25347|nr:hypothetical protein [Bordetella genomosp. 13]
MSHAKPPVRQDYDSAWKEALERFLPQAIEMFAPDLHARVDWRQPPVFLDKELQDLASGNGRGRRHVDKLIRLDLASGRYRWLLLHVEVESRRPSCAGLRRTTLRVRQYDYRIHDRHILRPALAHRADMRPATVYTIVVFTRGSGPDWLTADHQALQNAQPLRYRAVYLGRWLARWEALQDLARGNAFGLIVMAQLLAHRHRGPARLAPKIGLVRLLRVSRYSIAESISLMKLIDWILRLPHEHESTYVQALEDIEKEFAMGYVPSWERYYTKRGIEIGLKQGEEIGLKQGEAVGERRAWLTALQDQLEQKFGSVPEWVPHRLQQAEPAELRGWLRRILAADSPQALFND